jgi:hypothetical protein
MVTVYRVETVDGDGPYWRGPGQAAIHGDLCFDYERAVRRVPTPYLDNLSGFNHEHSFGFKSREQLEAWFTRSEREYLAGCHFLVSVYEVDDDLVQYGNKQVVFDRKAATLCRHEALI